MCCSSQLEWDCLAVCVLYSDPHVPTGNVQVTREQKVAGSQENRSLRTDDVDHVKERDVESLMVCWRSAEAADDVEHADFLWEVGTVLAAHCHHE